MYIKSFLTSIALAASIVSAAKSSATTTASAAKASSSSVNVKDYWKSFTSGVDPKNIQLPKTTQTTSNDPASECTYYEPPVSNFNPKEWPNLWETATSNGMDKTPEFINLYNSINWDNKPKNISVRKLNADGSVNFNGYDEANDPDCWWSSSTCTVPKHKGVNADIYTCQEPETFGLTYDDGPNCSHNAFYDYLQQQNLKASMFYIGSNVVNWQYGAMRGVRDGHHIADHTWSHQLMTTLTDKEVLAELYYTQKAIKVVTGVTPRHWRPAFGDVDDRVRWIATQLGLTTILWNYDTDDWSASESAANAKQVQANYDSFIQMGSNGTMSTHGNIVLTHEIDNTTMSLAIKNLPSIMKSYKHVIDVATCNNVTNPYQENDVTFPTFAQYLSGKTGTTAGTNSTSSAGSSGSSSSSSNGNSSSNASAANQSSSTSAGMNVAPTLAGFTIATFVTLFGTLF
ncbi:unnamed protein product [Cunninghamella blakesleeana]